MSSFVLRCPKLGTVHQCWNVSYVLANRAQHAASFHLTNRNSLFVVFVVHEEPYGPLLKTPFQPVSAQSVLLQGVITPQVQNFALVFPKLHEAPINSFLSLSGAAWVTIWPSSVLVTPLNFILPVTSLQVEYIPVSQLSDCRLSLGNTYCKTAFVV